MTPSTLVLALWMGGASVHPTIHPTIHESGTIPVHERAEGQLPRRPSAFAVRMVKAGGSLSDPQTQEHLRFAADAGFNAVWIYSHEAGLWTSSDAPGGPFLYPDFLETARWCRERRIRMAVSVNPVADSRGEFVFHDRIDERRIRRFFRLLRRAGVRDFVLSFDDQPTELVELDDVLRYGLGAAPAHLDLVRRVERSMRRRDGFWLCASVYCTSHLAKARPYARAFLEIVPRLPLRIGIVWTGPTVISKSVTGSDIASIRSRLGGRALLLYDNYPANDDIRPPHSLGLILGPLRHRDAALASEAAAYLACPMTSLGASRLPLLTAADYLSDPAGYRPDASWQRAILRLAGEDSLAREALRAQASDWGGWIGDPDYQDIDRENPASAADDLLDVNEAERWARTASLYPGRMIDLARLADAPFRRDLLAAMSRRLAVARAAPLARRYFEEGGASAPGRERILGDLRLQRLSLAKDPEGLRAFDGFLEAAEVTLAEESYSAPAPVPVQ